MEVQTSGRCGLALTKQQCEDGPYPVAYDAEWNWASYAGSSRNDPGGCFVYDNSHVSFNEHHGKECTVDTPCLCSK